VTRGFASVTSGNLTEMECAPNGAQVRRIHEGLRSEIIPAPLQGAFGFWESPEVTLAKPRVTSGY